MEETLEHLISPLLKPSKLYSRSEVLFQSRSSLKKSGFCAWYFKEIPSGVPIDGCRKQDGLTLLYLGNSGDLYMRIVHNHLKGTADISTLRLSLGVLLNKRLGGGEYMNFIDDGESELNAWMAENAFVCWMEHPKPLEIKAKIIKSVSLPLNIINNKHHPFCSCLKKKREEAKQKARAESAVA